jgi:hypothetical protein
MACGTRCVLSWEINRRPKPAVHAGNLWRLNARFFCRVLIQDPSSLEPPEGAVIESHFLNLSSKLVFCSAHSLLEATQKLVLLAIGKRQIVVSQLTIFLL